jgi:hypothetical protein
MKKYQKAGFSFVLVILLAGTLSSSAHSRSEAQSWIKRRLTYNAAISYNPAIAVKDNTIHVVWVDRKLGKYDIFYRRSSNNGTTWSKPKRLTRNEANSYLPAIAVSGDNIHVVWTEYTLLGNFHIDYKRSTDNGASWGKTKRLTKNVGEIRYTAIAVSGRNVHVVWNDDDNGNDDIFYGRSSNNGASWSMKKNLTHNTGASYIPSIAVSGSNVHVVWMDDTWGNSDIFYKHSSDNGVAWSKKRNLARSTGYSSAPSISVSGNNIHVVWQDHVGNDEIYYKRSTNNGSTWKGNRRLTKNAGASGNPDIAVSGGIVHVVWADLTPGNYEIFSKLSSDNGATWGRGERLTHNAEFSWAPDTAVSGSYVHVAWADEKTGNSEIFYKRGP